MNGPTRPLAEITEQAMSVLVRERGLANTARFLHQFGAGHGNYTEEREALCRHLTLDALIEQSRHHGRQHEE